MDFGRFITVRPFGFTHRGGGYEVLHVDLVPIATERIVPPAGEDYAYFRTKYKHHLEITISPTGRSVQIHLDGERIK